MRAGYSMTGLTAALTRLLGDTARRKNNGPGYLAKKTAAAWKGWRTRVLGRLRVAAYSPESSTKADAED